MTDEELKLLWRKLWFRFSRKEPGEMGPLEDAQLKAWMRYGVSIEFNVKRWLDE